MNRLSKARTYISRRETFSAAHKLYNSDWTTEQNVERFGKCAGVHGHNYVVHVTLVGNLDSGGMVFDIAQLKTILAPILVTVDHKALHEDVAPFNEGVPSTAEALSIWFWDQLEAPVTEAGGKLYEIKIEETEKNSAIFRGEFSD